MKSRLNCLIKPYYVKDKNSEYTHQRMGDGTNKFPGGKWNLSDSKISEGFYELYNKEYKNNNFRFQEKPEKFAPFRVDIDLKTKSKNKVCDKQIIKNFIDVYNNAIELIIDPTENGDDVFNCIVLEKKSPRKHKDIFKDGFHLHYTNFIVDINTQLFILKNVKKNYLKKKSLVEFFNKHNLKSDEVFDNISSKAWLMYGSRKPEDEFSWEITNAYDAALNEIDIEDVIDINNIPKSLSILGHKEITPIIKIEDQKPKQNSIVYPPLDECSEQAKNNFDEIKRILPKISPDCPENEWTQIAFAIHKATGGSQEAFDLFDEWSQRSEKYEEDTSIDRWNRADDDAFKGDGIKTLRKYAEIIDEKSIEIKQENQDPNILTWVDFRNEYNYMHFKDKFNQEGKIEKTSFELIRDELIPKLQNVFCFLEGETTGQYLYKMKGKIVRHSKPLPFYIFDNEQRISMVQIHARHMKVLDKVFCEWIPYTDPNDVKLDKDNFNTFTGLKAKLLKEEELDMKLIEPILIHIKEVMANNDETSYNFIINWMANIIQRPFRKTQVALFFYSEGQQVGKGRFKNILKNLIGHSNETSNINHVTGTFNSACLNNKLINVLEEMSIKSSFVADFEKLKNYITEESLTTEGKNVDPGERPSYCNFIFLSNHKNVIKVEQKDKRYAMFECSEKYSGNTRYFNKLTDAIENPIVMAHLRTYLHYKIELMHLQNNIPKTKLKIEVLELSKPSYERFIDDVKSGEFDLTDHKSIEFNDEKCIWVTDIYNAYKSWCKYSEDKPITQKTFSSVVKIILGDALPRKLKFEDKKMKAYELK